VRARLHLTFPQHLLQEPVIYRLGHELGLVTNIRRANIDDTAGWVILEVEGSQEALAEAAAWLSDQGIHVDRIADDQGG
jgi:L-aspartate semialdehyde sulfurtransferase ferredoxin